MNYIKINMIEVMDLESSSQLASILSFIVSLVSLGIMFFVKNDIHKITENLENTQHNQSGSNTVINAATVYNNTTTSPTVDIINNNK